MRTNVARRTTYYAVYRVLRCENEEKNGVVMCLEVDDVRN